MRQLIKKIIKAILPRRIKAALRMVNFEPECSKRVSKLTKLIRIYFQNTFIYHPKGKDEQIAAAEQFSRIVNRINFKKVVNKEYFYPYDPSILKLLHPQTRQIVSLTLDYTKVLNLDLTALRKKMELNDDSFSTSIARTIDSIEVLRKRSIKFYSKRKDARSIELRQYFDRLMSGAPTTLDEALQKILFFNALQWGFGHKHIGLGRLDLILEPYYTLDIANGIAREQLVAQITNFIKTLGANTLGKSGALIGDTGQVILLSGLDRNGNYVENELTHIFLEVIRDINVGDPKLILRVCEQTTDQLWHAAVDCVSKGNGSPLMANETKIRALMEDFGYESSDTVDFGTSACWEPLIVGKSFDQNNPTENINLVLPMISLMQGGNYTTYDDFQQAYLIALSAEARRVTEQNRVLRFDRSPLMSIWMDGCVESLTDISQGGAKYNYHGFLCSGLPNAVNSLLNIKRYVFEDQAISLDQLNSALSDNYASNETLRNLLLSNPLKFGKAVDEVLSITSSVMNSISDVVATTTINGQKAKIGFSSPAYLLMGKQTPATPDGRLEGDPFSPHISPVSKEVDFAEIIDFASKLDYSGNKINGNVVDFILCEQYVRHAEKFIEILKIAFRKGVFEMQLNVLDAEQLSAARANPLLYPNLVVRIWGFSAYFNDLPDSYKDMLIARAIDSQS